MKSLGSEPRDAGERFQRYTQGHGSEEKRVRRALRGGAEVDANERGDADELADEARRQDQSAQVRGLLGANGRGEAGRERAERRRVSGAPDEEQWRHQRHRPVAAAGDEGHGDERRRRHQWPGDREAIAHHGVGACPGETGRREAAGVGGENQPGLQGRKPQALLQVQGHADEKAGVAGHDEHRLTNPANIDEVA